MILFSVSFTVNDVYIRLAGNENLKKYKIGCLSSWSRVNWSVLLTAANCDLLGTNV
jgi:hypothetical protein